MTEVRTRLAVRLPDFTAARKIGSQLVRLPCADAWPVSTGRGVPLWAVASAGLSPIVLIGGWLVSGAVQPASYNPVRQTISVLAGQGGTDRWFMTGALFLVGGCYLVTAAGLSLMRWPSRVLLVIAGLSSIGIATSPEPPGGPTPVHLAWTVIGGITIAIWPTVAGWSAPPEAPVLRAKASAIVTALFVVLLGWVVIQTQGGSDLGLAERLASSVQTSWPFVVAVLLRRSTIPGSVA